MPNVFTHIISLNLHISSLVLVEEAVSQRGEPTCFNSRGNEWLAVKANNCQISVALAYACFLLTSQFDEHQVALLGGCPLSDDFKCPLSVPWLIPFV